MKRFPFELSFLCCLFLTACSRPEAHVEKTPGSSPEAVSGGSLTVLPQDSPKLSRIRVAAVSRSDFPDTEVVAPGKVEVNPNRVSRVLMPAAGRVRRVLVQLGDAVRQGQPLLTVESPEIGAAMAAYRQAEAQIRQARASLSKAEKDLARTRDLYEHRAAALKDVLAAEMELTQSQAAVEQADAAADEARERLKILGQCPAPQSGEACVSAPISGKILEIAVAPGEYRNDTSASLMTLADLSTVWVTSSVPESSIRAIQPGERLELELAAYPGESFHARVTRIADMVDPQTRTVKVQAELDNRAGRLRPEMFGEIRHTHGSRSLPALPASAVVQAGSGPSVYVERGPGRFERVPVRTGEPRRGLVPILEGLSGGERVVVDGAVLLGAR